MLESRIPQAIALARRHNYAVAVSFLDLDGFKLVNDTFGHPVGDRLLQSVARVLERSVRSSDTVCRFPMTVRTRKRCCVTRTMPCSTRSAPGGTPTGCGVWCGGRRLDDRLMISGMPRRISAGKRLLGLPTK
ncbi:MAG: GGDEF domain-containing protein [Steroidobacteraceae bacterium]